MTRTTATTVRVTELSRSYGRVVALDRVSFMARPGEILGLLGPNGAGKSTAMKVITGFLAADSGTVHFDVLRGSQTETGAVAQSLEVHDHPIACRELTGWMPESVPVYEDMEAAAFLKFVGDARGLDAATVRARTQSVADGIGLTPMLGRKIRELSRGYRQRVGLAQALLHDPPVVILDEPTSGLDPTQITGLHEYLLSLARDQRKTVIFSSHILSEVEAIADSLVVVARGNCVFTGTCEGMRMAAADRRLRVRVRFASPARAPAFVANLTQRLAGWTAETFEDGSMVVSAPGSAGEPVVTESGRVVIDPGALDAGAAFAAITDAASSSGAGLVFMDRELPGLSEAFLRIVATGTGGRGDVSKGAAA